MTDHPMVQKRKQIEAWARGDPKLLSARCVKTEQALDEARGLLLSIEGAILGYWTDMPQNELEDFRVRIREYLGDWEPQP